jgi:hypothetical protein
MVWILLVLRKGHEDNLDVGKAKGKKWKECIQGLSCSYWIL